MYQVILLDESKSDIHDARSYFRSLVAGLEKRFYMDLLAIMKKLENNPQSFGFRFEEFRTANLKIFPYQVHYQIDEGNKRVIVFAVLHSYRNPDFIKSRMG